MSDSSEVPPLNLSSERSGGRPNSLASSFLVPSIGWLSLSNPLGPEASGSKSESWEVPAAPASFGERASSIDSLAFSILLAYSFSLVGSCGVCPS